MLLAASTLNAQQHKLTIVVDGMEQTAGTLYVAVYDAENFMKKSLYGTLAKVDREEITIVLDSIAPGEYAASIFHDENDNGNRQGSLRYSGRKNRQKQNEEIINFFIV